MWLRRTPWAVLLIPVLLLGAVDWHPAEDLHGATASGPGEVYFPGAAHPDQPVHFEQADPAHRPLCPVCVHRMQTSGAYLPLSVVLAPPVRQAREAVEAAPLRSSTALRSSGARAPPVLS
ncbi:MAG TPA: hypothetical protein VF789_34705 [Thermoanaerobaculia bacterium]